MRLVNKRLGLSLLFALNPLEFLVKLWKSVNPYHMDATYLGASTQFECELGPISDGGGNLGSQNVCIMVDVLKKVTVK